MKDFLGLRFYESPIAKAATILTIAVLPLIASGALVFASGDWTATSGVYSILLLTGSALFAALCTKTMFSLWQTSYMEILGAVWTGGNPDGTNVSKENAIIQSPEESKDQSE